MKNTVVLWRPRVGRSRKTKKKIAIIFLAFYYLYVKYFRFSNNQNETSEDLHNGRTNPSSCFQQTNSNDSDVTMNDSYQVMSESFSQLNRNVSLSLPAFWEKEPIAWFKCVDVFFASQRIRKQSEMFDHVLKRLPPKYWRH